VNWRVIWQYAVAPGVPRRSLAAAVVVGTVLNLINQGGRAVRRQIARIGSSWG